MVSFIILCKNLAGRCRIFILISSHFYFVYKSSDFSICHFLLYVYLYICHHTC
ncbi:unnamed protein product [Arabidopsis halleri]